MLDSIINKSNKGAKRFYEVARRSMEQFTFEPKEKYCCPRDKVECIAQLLGVYIQKRMFYFGNEVAAINYTLREWTKECKISFDFFSKVIIYLKANWKYGDLLGKVKMI